MYQLNCKNPYNLLNREDDDDDKSKLIHGHITSISVLRSYRRLGVASKLMSQACMNIKFKFSNNDG